MLVLLNNWALRLAPLYAVSLVIAAAGALLSAGLLLGVHNPQVLAIRCSLLLTLWALTLFVFLNLFRKPPPLMLPALPLRERMLIRLQFGLYYGMALVFTALVLVVLNLSVKLLMHA